MSTKRKTMEALSHENNWVCPSDIIDVRMNDHFSTWLKYYGTEEVELSKMLNFIFKQGRRFEELIVHLIRQKFESSIISTMYKKPLVLKTIDEMKKGTPIIHSAPLCCETSQMYGVADLLVRSDFINKLVPGTLDEKEETKGCGLSENYHYRVIDIKFSTLPLRANGTNILDQDRYPAYKSQLFMYNHMIGNIQGYTPSKAYIMGRKYKYTTCGTTHHGKGAFDKLGVVDFNTSDCDIPEKTREAILWVRLCRREGKEWTRESHPELYPNLKNDSFYSSEKNRIAESIGEITQLWYCGVDQREIALSKGVSSWKDPRFCASLIDMKHQRGVTLDNILEVNRNPFILYTPIKLKVPIQTMEKEFYVDFETMAGPFDDFTKLPLANPCDMIFMIGVGWYETDEMNNTMWITHTLTVDQLTSEEEKRILSEFIALVGDGFCYHWSYAEPTGYKNACLRHQLEAPLEWIDLLTIVRDEPITIKGCFNYSLKSVVKALASHNFFDIEESEITDGSEAMILAYQEYSLKRTPQNSPVLQEVQKYNYNDVYALAKILSFIRHNIS